MKRLLPFPLLTLLLLAMWLVANQTLAAAHVLLGGVLAIGGGLAYARLEPATGRRVRHAGLVVQLVALVLADVVRSNIAVARIVMKPSMRGRTTGFVDIPLEMRHPAALASLACIITATPGTSWARYDRARNVLTIHLLDLIDANEWVRTFKQRYERRLRAIFEGA